LNPSSPRVTPRFVRTHDAAAFLGLSGRTLEKHRCTGTGPVFRKLGGRVVYAIEDLEVWAAERARNSTSDPGQNTAVRATLSQRATPPRGR
jgi:predicted DNA-binding transcriptional regulator AlpA